MSLLLTYGPSEPPRAEAASRRLPGTLARESLRDPVTGGSTTAFASVVWSDPAFVVAVSGTPRLPRAGLGDCPCTASEIAERWGRDGPASLAALHGAFALVVIERQGGRAHGYVDPFGRASLFCATVDGARLFCSEVEPLLALGAAADLDRVALQDVFALRHLCGRRSLWASVRQVVPGFLLTVGTDGQASEREIRRLRFVPRPALPQAPETVETACTTLGQMLEAGFGRRRDEGAAHVAVPLSGGVDSALMAAFAARAFPRVTAYTARIEGFENPELDRARDVAAKLRIEHRIVDVADQDVARLYPHLIGRLQEPPRHHNSLVVARLVEVMAQDCPLVVAGDTADTLAGNAMLGTVHNLRDKRQVAERLPAPMRTLAATLLARTRSPRLARLARILKEDFDGLVRSIDLLPRGPATDALLAGLAPAEGPTRELAALHYERHPTPYETYQTYHLRTFSTAAFRRNLRLGQAAGIEFWYPFKDSAIAGFMFGLPTRLKQDPATGASKPALRLLCDRTLGPEISRWSKLGFPSPEREWMEGPLAAELAACLRPDARVAAHFPPAAVAALDLWREHQTLWTLMTLESVLERAARVSAT